jgi:predicted transcriptional regulator
MVLGVATLSDVIAIAGGESPVGRRRCRRNSRVRGFRADLSRLISRDIETPQIGFEDLCMPTSKSGSTDPIGLAAEIVSAYVVHNSLPRAELPALIQTVYAALMRNVEGAVSANAVEAEAPAPAVMVRKSVTPDFLVCLDDGRKFKSLRRHLATLGMTPEQYRAKWSLPNDYPMVATNYAAQRSALAKKIGLGQFRKNGDAKRKPG